MQSTTNPKVTLLSEVPEDLHESLQQFLDTHPDWDQDRVFASALSLFLLQNGHRDRTASRVYLDSIFDLAA